MPVALPELDPAAASRLLQADLDSIEAKVASGKPLTEAEIRRLKTAAATAVENKGVTPIAGVPDDAGPKWVESQIDLAKALGVDRKTIQRHLNVDGCPGRLTDGRYNLHEWRTWLRFHGKKGGKGADKNALECKRLLLIIERQQLDNAIARGEYSKNSDIEGFYAEFAYQMRNLLDAMPGQLAPDVVSLDVPGAERVIRNAVEAVKAKISAGEWPKHEPC